MLSSTQRIEIGILAPHLSQSAVIPHFTAITPVRREFGVITLGFASIVRIVFVSTSVLKNRGGGGTTAIHRRRETTPLENANMAKQTYVHVIKQIYQSKTATIHKYILQNFIFHMKLNECNTRIIKNSSKLYDSILI
jgi:hypothetical protein